jgi:hypothetical protein
MEINIKANNTKNAISLNFFTFYFSFPHPFINNYLK